MAQEQQATGRRTLMGWRLLVPWAAVVGLGSIAAMVGGHAKAALIAGVAVPGLFLTSLRTKLHAYLVILPLVGYLTVHYPHLGAQGLPSIIAGAMALHLFWELLVRRTRFPVSHPFVAFVSLYGIAVILQGFNPIVSRVGQGFTGVRTYLAPLVLFFAAVYLLRDQRQMRVVVQIILVTSIIVFLYSLKQFVFGFDHAEQAYYAAHPGAFVTEEKKLFSTLVAPDISGFVFAFYTLVGLAARLLRIWPRIALVSALLSGVEVLASGARIAVGTVLVSGAVLLLLHVREVPTRTFAFRALTAGTGVLVVLVTIVAVTPVRPRYGVFAAHNPVVANVEKLALLKQGRADPDLNSRLTRIGRFTVYLIHHPWGTGPGVGTLLTFNTVTQPGGKLPNLPDYVLHSPFIFQHDFYYVDVGVELGAIPLGMLWLIWAVAIRYCLDARRRTENQFLRGWFSLVVSVVVLGFLYNLTNESFRDPQVAGYIWLLVGSAVSIDKHALGLPPRRAEPPT